MHSIVDIQAGISMQGHSAMDIRKICMNGYPRFMDVSLQLSMLNGYLCGYPWISMDTHMDIIGFQWISIHMDILRFLWLSILMSLDFYGHQFGYPWISMDIHALTCYGFSIQGKGLLVKFTVYDGRKLI